MMTWLRNAWALLGLPAREHDQFTDDLADLEQRQITTNNEAARLEDRVARFERLRREQRRLAGD